MRHLLIIILATFFTLDSGAQISGDIEVGGANFWGASMNIRKTTIAGNGTVAWITRFGLGHSFPSWDGYHMSVNTGLDYGWKWFEFGMDYAHYFDSPFYEVPAANADLTRDIIYPHVRHRFRKNIFDFKLGFGAAMMIKASYDGRPYIDQTSAMLSFSFGIISKKGVEKHRSWL